MNCPYCLHNKNEVYNSRRTKRGAQIWRRRRCTNCNQSFTTYEQRDISYLQIKKSDDTTETYQRHKLFSSLYKTFDGLPDQTKEVYFLTETIEDKIVSLGNTTISTTQVATIILGILERYHRGAHLRYGSFRTNLMEG